MNDEQPPAPILPPPPAQGAEMRPYAPPVQPPANGFAVAALVLGIVGLVGTIFIWVGLVCDVLAIVFGVIGRNKAKEGAPNKGMATAGMILGIIGLALVVFLILAFFSVVDSGNYAPVG